MQIPFHILKEIKQYRRIFVQYPEGLKTKLFEIQEQLEKEGIEAIFDAEPTYGFCDIRDDEAVRLNCDAILHIGHNTFGFKLQSKIPVIIWEYHIEYSQEKIRNILEKNFSKIEKYEKIGIVSSLQYIKNIPILKKILSEMGKEAIVPRNPQILGCNVLNAKLIEKDVEAFLVPTSGRFYVLGLALEINKPVFCINFDKEQIEDVTELAEKYKKILYYNYLKFKESSKVGILVSWKKGQIFFDPFKVKKELEKRGKNPIILVMDEIDQSKLYGIDVDIYINLACPRIFDGYEGFEKPIINWRDILKIEKISSCENHHNSGNTDIITTL